MSNGDDLVRGWEAAAEIAGRSVAGLRKVVEDGRLAAEKDDTGAYVFRRADLEALPPVQRAVNGSGASEATAPIAPAANGADGEMAAVVFADLAAGKTPAEIVVAHRLAPAAVRAAYEEWKDLRALGGSEARCGHDAMPEHAADVAPPTPAPTAPALDQRLTAIERRLGLCEEFGRLEHLLLDGLASGRIRPPR